MLDCAVRCRCGTQDRDMLTHDSGSAGEALEWTQRGNPFDLARLEMQQPKMDSRVLAHAIRRSCDEAALPLVPLPSLGRHETGEETGFAAVPS